MITQVKKQASGFNPDPKAASEMAAKKAVKLALGELVFPFEKAKSSHTPVTLLAGPFKTFEKLKKFYKTLLDVDMVTDFSLDEYKKGGDVSFTIYLDGANAEEFAASMLRKKPFEFSVASISQYKVELEIR
jgi:hypothetical protein